MAFNPTELSQIESALADFIAARRPPVEIRDKLEHAYRIEGQSVIIFEIRPRFDDRSEKIEIPVAKATYVRTANRWKIYCQRADLKWHSYPPDPEVLLFEEFLAVVDEDNFGCFWG